jgi:hypothetical protein
LHRRQRLDFFHWTYPPPPLNRQFGAITNECTYGANRELPQVVIDTLRKLPDTDHILVTTSAPEGYNKQRNEDLLEITVKNLKETLPMQKNPPGSWNQNNQMKSIMVELSELTNPKLFALLIDTVTKLAKKQFKNDEPLTLD